MLQRLVSPAGRRSLALIAACLSLVLGACNGGVRSAPQPPTGDNSPTGTRYINRVFTDFDETPGIQYGSGERTQGTQALFMDIYTPQGDTETDRPVVLLAFGGGFVSGVRSDVRDLAIDFALRGYVAATIDYRLLETQPANADAATIALLQPLHDLKAAVRFFREDAATNDTYRTDGEFVFAAGVSAGAVLAMTSAVLDDSDLLSPAVRAWLDENGGLDGNSSANAGQYSSEVQAALSVSGAIGDLSWVDVRTLPIIAVHEEFDQVVPCNVGTSDIGGFTALSVGPCEVMPLAQTLGIRTQFLLLTNATTHVGYTPSQITTILESSAFFFATLLR